MPSESRLAVALEELDRPALAVLGVVAAEHRLEALHVQPVAVAVLVPVLVERVEQLAGAGDERSRSASRGTTSPGRRASSARLAGQLLVEAEALVPPRQLAQLSPKITSSVRARGVQHHHVAQRASSRLRSMLMIGVMPLLR